MSGMSGMARSLGLWLANSNFRLDIPLVMDLPRDWYGLVEGLASGLAVEPVTVVWLMSQVKWRYGEGFSLVELHELIVDSVRISRKLPWFAYDILEDYDGR